MVGLNTQCILIALVGSLPKYTAVKLVQPRYADNLSAGKEAIKSLVNSALVVNITCSSWLLSATSLDRTFKFFEWRKSSTRWYIRMDHRCVEDVTYFFLICLGY